MSRRATVSAPANIAFVKYWGARDVERALPHQPSISMTLEVCRSLTTVEARDDLARDEVWLAAEDGRLEIVRILVDAKAGLNVRDLKSGQTPLMAAALGGHDAVVTVLLQAAREMGARRSAE
ncbi:MAG TPA: ankyrin repeat domain-containing protein, partial [Thermoanaerobaculia bacterium]|nr:ankyrin repeat domain-containing protein [Thermoanaerobaculia bacterium]